MVQVNTDAIAWWRHCLTDQQKVELIIKEHPNSVHQSDLMRLALWSHYNKNPQKLFDNWVKENDNN